MKFLVLTMSRKADWHSVRVISYAMEKIYRKLSREMSQHQFEFIEADLDSIERDFLFSNGYIYKLIERINHYKADKIIFTEPHVSQFPITDLILRYDSRPKNKKDYIFYIYGSFTYYIEKWLALNKSLEGKNISFITASNPSQALTSSFFVNREIVSKNPYPINFETFSYKKEIRKNFRERHFIKNNEKVFIYAGRISEQKNILSMLKLLKNNYTDQTPIKIIFAGRSDELSNKTFGKKEKSGHFFTVLQENINQLSDGLKEKIIFLGHLSQEELCEAFNGSDFLISLSTHHDEDYGIIVTQALKTGLPCLLSPWGGYNDFIKDSKLCTPLPFSYQEEQIGFNQAKFSNWFSSALESIEDRKEEDLYSERNILENLKNILVKEIPEWEGFNGQANLLLENKKRGLTLYKDPLYHRIYKHYL